MSEYNFPRILPYNHEAGHYISQWKHEHEIAPWFERNIRDFLFDLNEIRGNAVEFDFDKRYGPEDCGIYFLQWDGDVVYVGKSVNIANRLRAHKLENKKVWTHFWCMTGVSKLLQPYVEYLYIGWLQPIANKVNDGQTPAADALIEELEPYMPFRAMRSMGGWLILGDDTPDLNTDGFYVR